MTAQEKAQAIRKELKKLGWNSRQVSVRVRYVTYDAAIDVEVKDPNVPLHVVEKIVNQHESIDRCHASGEILAGGNTYTHVEYADDLIEERANALEPFISDEKGVPVIIGKFEVWLSTGGNGYWSEGYRISIAGKNLNENIACHDKRSAARALAIALLNDGFETCGRWVSAD